MEEIKMIQKYNSKIDLLVAKYTCHDVPIKQWSHLRLKRIFFGKECPQDDYERNLCIVKQCLEIMKRQEVFDVNVVKQWICLFGGSLDFNETKFMEIVKNNEETKVFYLLLQEKMFGEINFEISSLTFNYLRMLKDKIPIAIYLHTKEDIDEILANGQGYETFQKKMSLAILHCLSKNRKHRLLPASIVEDKIRENEEVLKKEYGVEKFFIYGSFSYEEATDYSDIDIYIEVKEEWKKDLNHKYRIFQFLKKILGLPIDGHVNDDEFHFENFTDDIKHHLKQIF